MGNKIVTLVTSFVLLIAFILMVAFISTDSQNDKSKQLVREFTETVRYKGYVTYDQYSQLIDSIPYKNIKVQITHTINENYEDNNSDKSIGTLDMKFTAQIIGSQDDPGNDIIKVNGKNTKSGTLLYTGTETDKNIYKMQTGDQIQVDLFIMEGTFFDSIVGAFTGSGSPSIKILTSASGVILNEKYDNGK